MTDNRKTRYIPNVSFHQIGGIKSVINKIREVIELPLKHPDLFKHIGIKPHKGILLYGPPGNGKTMIAKAIANEVKAHFIPISGPELLSKMHGESEANLRKVFSEARDMEPAIIFFDEIDAIAQKRSFGENGRLDSKFVNQLLTLMDGFEAYENVTILASTNRPELLDPALMRPGRFDYKLEINNPDEDGCFDIFCIASRNMPIEEGFDRAQFSTRLHGLSGAEITFVAQEAGYNALRRSFDLEAVIKADDDEVLEFADLKVESTDFESALSKALEIHGKNQPEQETEMVEIVDGLIQMNKPVKENSPA